MKKVAKIGLVYLMALGALMAGSAAALQTGPGEENEPGKAMEDGMMTISIGLCFDIEKLGIEGTNYNRIRILDGGVEPGNFGEERHFYRYLFKTGGAIEDIDVDLGAPSNIPGEPTPCMVPGILGEEPNIHPDWEDGRDITTGTAWKLTEVGRSDGMVEYSLKIYPVAFEEDKAKIHQNIQVVVQLVEEQVLSSWLQRSGKPIGDIDYLVITHKDLKSAVVPLAEWKTQKGLFSLVYTTEEIDRMYEEGDIASKMRSLVMELEKEYDLDYMLLAGDTDKVPTRSTYNAYPASQYGEPSNYATDGYFACVDEGTTWNKDRDSRYAEPGEIDDAIPDLAVGRLAISDPSIMSKKIAELIGREKVPEYDDKMLTAILMGGDNQNVPGSSVDFMEYQWETYWDDIFESRETIYFDGSGSLSFSSSSVKKMLDMKTQFMAYFSHGRYESIPELYSRDDVADLEDNGSAGMLFAMACVTGWFDQGTGGMISGTGNCFAEAMTETPDKGLAGYIGASRLAAGACDDSYSGDAPGLEEDYFRAVRMVMNDELEPTVGAVYREAVKRFSTSFYPFPNNQNDVSARTFQEYNLLGEPDAPLILHEGGELNLQYSLAADQKSLSAKVTDGNDDPVQDALVTVTRLGELGISARTDANGEVRMSIPPSNGGLAIITAYREGDRPDQASFVLEDELAPTGDHFIDPEEPDGRNGYYVTFPEITILGDEPVTVEYRWNSGEAVQLGPGGTVEAAEGNNTLYYRVRDPADHVSRWYQVNISVDTLPPVITAEVSPAVPDGENGVYITRPSVRIGSAEALIDMKYQIDNLIKRDLEDKVTVPEGSHEIKLWASDQAGNTAITNISLIVDTEAPFSSVLLSHLPDGENGYYVTPPSIEIELDDDEAMVQYRWDEGNWEEYAYPLIPDEGYHILYHRSIDPAGNVEDERYREFMLDTVAPDLQFQVEPSVPSGNDGYYTETPEVSAISDGSAVFYAKVPMGQNADGEISWSPLETLLSVPDGEWTYYLRARDEAGNEITSDPIDIKVDTGIPDLFWLLSPFEPPTGKWYHHTPTLSVSTTHSDAELYWKYQNSDEWTPYSGSFDLSGGRHSLMVMAADAAGNEVVKELPEIKVDTDSPWIELLSMENGTVYGPGEISIVWEGGDLTSETTFQAKLDDGPWTGAGTETSILLRGIEDGMHTIAVKVIDETGREATTWRTFGVDGTAPSIVDISPNGEDNPANSVIEVLFSEEMDRGSVIVQVPGVRGNVTWEGNRMIFRPKEALKYGTEYKITVSGSDILGNEMEDYTHVFSTYPIVIDDVVEEPDSEGGSFILPIIIAACVVSLMIGIGAAILVMKRRSFTIHEE